MGGSLGFSPKAQECVESGGTLGACSKKDGASIQAGEAFHILGSAEWEYRGPGVGEACPGVDMGDLQGSPALLVSVGVSGRAQTSEVTVSFPGGACPGEQDQGGQRPVRWFLCISPWVAWALPSPHPPQSFRWFRGSHKGGRNRGGVALA